MCTSAAGILPYRRLRENGSTRTMIDAAVRSGTLTRVRRGVYATPEACAEAIRAAAHGGVLACVSAARHLGIWVLDRDLSVHVWLDRRGHRYRHADGCSCVEHWDGGPPRDAFGAASVPRILRQILACRGLEEFFVATESALHLGLLNAAGRAWLGAHTNPQAREALSFARSDAESGLESLVRWRLRSHGLRVRTQLGVATVGRVDLLIGDRLIVEVDGAENHDAPSHRHKDLVRDANAAVWGYTTLRFDYALVVHDWSLVESAILATVARLAA